MLQRDITLHFGGTRHIEGSLPTTEKDN